MARSLTFFVAMFVSIAACALTGQVVGTTGTSQGARFSVTGSVLAVNQTSAIGARYSVMPLMPEPQERPDAIFDSGFE